MAAMAEKKAAVFILLGQSNAVGHGVPMQEKDILRTPLKNVFGLHRRDNQSLSLRELHWRGYTSAGMNLAEEQDDTYSVANCLAAQWQQHIDGSNKADLPDLYIIQIAIGAQGVTDGFMWHPARAPRLLPGKLGTVDISLFPFSMHIFSLLEDSFKTLGKPYEIIGLHWRGGEEDVAADSDKLHTTLDGVYTEMIDAFNRTLHTPPIVLHRLAARDRMNDMDATGQRLGKMQYINTVFAQKQQQYPNVSVFDVRTLPQYTPDVRGNGIFIEDMVHYTPAVNRAVAEYILNRYIEKTV